MAKKSREVQDTMGLSENRLAYYAIAEQFLARFLGGRAEPTGSEVSESRAEIRAGGDIITQPPK
jgi:hypothetical protein